MSIHSKLLTKLRPEFTDFIQNANFARGSDDVITLDDSPYDIIKINDHEEVKFCQTGNLDNTMHQDNQNIGKVHQKFSKFNSNTIYNVKIGILPVGNSHNVGLRPNSGFRSDCSHRYCDQKRRK